MENDFPKQSSVPTHGDQNLTEAKIMMKRVGFGEHKLSLK